MRKWRHLRQYYVEMKRNSWWLLILTKHNLNISYNYMHWRNIIILCPYRILGYYFVFVEQKYTLNVSNIHHVLHERTQETTCISGIHTISVLFVLSIMYSQLHMKGIEQHTMPMQSLSFLHVHGIHSIKSMQVLYQLLWSTTHQEGPPMVVRNEHWSVDFKKQYSNFSYMYHWLK
jgi:hypothetical protein